MQQLDTKINQLEKYLFAVIDKLDNLRDENFESSFEAISFLVKNIDGIKHNIIENYEKDEVKSKSDTVHSAIKQIKCKFDSIIEEKKKLQVEIKNQLVNTVNQKKLINYQR